MEKKYIRILSFSEASKVHYAVAVDDVGGGGGGGDLPVCPSLPLVILLSQESNYLQLKGLFTTFSKLLGRSGLSQRVLYI